MSYLGYRCLDTDFDTNLRRAVRYVENLYPTQDQLTIVGEVPRIIK